MKATLRKDSILTIFGFALITGVFLFAFYLPEAKVLAKVKQEIKAVQDEVQNIPFRLAEIESLQNDVTRRKTFVSNARAWVPFDPDVHAVIHQVAELARNSDLQITRLEPRAAVAHATFQEVPFRLSFSGSFREMATFFKGLESRDRLFTVQQFTLKQKDGKAASTIEADLHFSVLIGHAEFADSAENNGSRGGGAADKRQ